jgi:GntR family transcriptional regulator
VRPAIAILEREGRLERVKGRGTFVRPPKATHTLGGLTRIAAAADAGRRAALEIIEVRDDEPQSEIEQVLGPSGGKGVRRVTAVLREHDTPVALFWSFLSPDVGWAAGLEQGTAVAVEDLDSDLALTGGDCVIDTSWSTDFESSRLDIPGGTPILVAHCIEAGHRPGGPPPHPVEVAWVMCRADARRVRAQLGPLAR